MMRSFDYARTPPKAPEAFLVVVVRLVVVIMARTYAALSGRRQRSWAAKSASVAAKRG